MKKSCLPCKKLIIGDKEILIVPSKADLSVRASLPFGVKSIIITNPKTIDYSSIGESAIVYGSISSFEK